MNEDIKEDELPNILGFPLRKQELKSLKDGGFILYGKGTLSSGVLTITNNRIRVPDSGNTKGSFGFASYNTSGGTMGSTLRVVITSGVATITSMIITGTVSAAPGSVTITGTTTASSDSSTVNYLIIL